MNRRPIEPLKLVEIERFAKKFKINGENGCWEWCASKNQKGYGQFDMNRIQYKAHRVSYAIKHGGLYSQLQIDHLCRNRGCVNPDHLELVTNKENVLRGELPRTSKERFANQTHCKRGHEFTEANTHIHMQTEATGKIYKARHCLSCRRIRTKAITEARIRLQGATR